MKFLIPHHKSTKEEERMVLALIEVIVLEKETDTQAASYNALW